MGFGPTTLNDRVAATKNVILVYKLLCVHLIGSKCAFVCVCVCAPYDLYLQTWIQIRTIYNTK